jgi:hypothetical protein
MKKDSKNKKIVKVEHKSALRPEPTRMGRGPTKTFQQDGHWIVKIKKTPILVCECGNRYLKTRPQQLKCLRCLAYRTTEHR